MKIVPCIDYLKTRIVRQLDNVAGYWNNIEIDKYMDGVLTDMEEALVGCRIKQVRNANGEIEFRTTHLGQYAMFLWFLSRKIYMDGKEELADQISYLNSSLNMVFLNHKVDMPRHFYLDHPFATIIGRAEIGDYFFCMQHCTIGAVTKPGGLVFPKLGSHVEMMAGSSVIGNCTIGDYVILADHAVVKNRDIPCNSIVFGQDRAIIVKQLSHMEMLKHMTCFTET